MPVAPPTEAPSISRIYAAFDDACYAVFRRAMARSRGGVVCVEDVLAALAETLPECTASVLGWGPAAVARLGRLPAAGPDLLPMSNEPALRSALADAYAQADGGSITPPVLLRAAARSLAGMRRSLREPVPPAHPAPARCPPPTPHRPTAQEVQAVLRRWLEVQSWPAAECDRALQQLADLSPPRIESEGLAIARRPAESAADAPAD